MEQTRWHKIPSISFVYADEEEHRDLAPSGAQSKGVAGGRSNGGSRPLGRRFRSRHFIPFLLLVDCDHAVVVFILFMDPVVAAKMHYFVTLTQVHSSCFDQPFPLSLMPRPLLIGVWRERGFARRGLHRSADD